MIRFTCASCQKVLNAPDDKAGKRFACPGCKSPVEVPAASTVGAAPAIRATAGAAADQEPPKGFAGEVLAIVLATFRQTLKPITYIFEVFRRSRLRRKSDEAQFKLGQRMYEAKLGDAKLRGRIQSLGERIHSIQDVSGDAKGSITERKGLILLLAEPMVGAATAPDAVAGEHERASLLKSKLKDQEEALAGAFGGLLPPSGTAWRRVLIGYSLAALVAVGVAWQMGLLTRQPQVSSEVLAQADRAKQDDADWAKERNAEQIVEKCGPSVALIRFKVGKKEGGGTGFVIRPGVIATNAHVIDSVMPEELKVYYPSAKDIGKTAFPAQVLYFDRKRDLAFLAVEPKPQVPVLRLADNFEFRGGKNITIIGCPGVGEMQLENAVNVGVLSTKTEVEKMPYYQLGAPVNPGNSGGPVFDNRGQVIGVVTLKASQESISFCIPWQDLKDRLEALEKEDPHKAALAAQSAHTMFVVIERLFVTSMVYSKIMQGYGQAMREATSRGRSPEDGVAQARPIFEALLRKASAYMMDAKHHAIGSKLLNDPNLPQDVRQRYTNLWHTYEELKRNVDKPAGTFNSYMSKAQHLESQAQAQIEALAQALGFEKRKVEEDDDF